jgi:integral membrane protein
VPPHARSRSVLGSGERGLGGGARMSDVAARDAVRGAGVADKAAARSIERLRIAGKIEGVSYLLLLGVAMPLKYFAGLPLAVKITGWAHGLLFVVFVSLLVLAMQRARLSFAHACLAFIASLLPFGPFVIDRRLEAAARGDGKERAGNDPSVG